jgi:hypothetical protein
LSSERSCPAAAWAGLSFHLPGREKRHFVIFKPENEQVIFTQTENEQVPRLMKEAEGRWSRFQEDFKEQGVLWHCLERL